MYAVSEMHWISSFQILCEHLFSSALTLCPLMSYYHSCHVLSPGIVVSVYYHMKLVANSPRCTRAYIYLDVEGVWLAIAQCSTASAIHVHMHS